MQRFKTIPERRHVTREQFFDDIFPAQQPVIIRGFAKHWPLVKAAQVSSASFARYLEQFYNGQNISMFVAPPEAKKRFYYNEDLTGVNFLSGEEQLDVFLGRLIELIGKEVYPAFQMAGVHAHSVLPDLMASNSNELFSHTAAKISVGNESIINTQYQTRDNFTCIVAGRCRYKLLPPEQTKNLYPGPLNFTPTGVPTSLVDFNAPDFEQFPLFKHALEHTYSVELSPGDAIFVPMLWWHHIETLDKVNAEVSYHWQDSALDVAHTPTAIDSLNLALLAMRDLSQEQRKSWRFLFDHYLFKQGVDPTSYIPKHQHHLLGKLSDEYVIKARQYFASKLTQ